MGRAVSGGSARRFAQGIHRTLYDQRLGDVRSSLPRHLHCQFSRFHDHQGGILRIFRSVNEEETTLERRASGKTNFFFFLLVTCSRLSSKNNL